VSARVVGISAQHHILGVVRAALNWGVRQRKIRFNPALGLDLPPRTREPVVVYDAEQVRAFLRHAEAVHDRLALLYRLVLLRGMRRGEAVGLRWSGLYLDAGIARIERPILQDQLGHSTSAITRDLYTHVVPALCDNAAERVAALVELPIRHAKDAGA